jgi:Domain of unknown function (DUF1707)
MSEPSSPTAGEPGPRPRARYASPGMRISDAERAEVADRLSKHYGDGRLDQAEFSRRLDQAMHAVTQADLSGLFDDLPETGPDDAGPEPSGSAPAGPARAATGAPRRAGACRGRRRDLHRVIALAIFVVIAAIIGRALSHLFLPWILIAAVVFLWLRHDRGRRRRGPSAD